MAGRGSQERRKTVIYKWKTFNYSVPAQSAGEHIEELDREHGHVTPEILLDDSRPEGALLHPLYEWDNETAAEKYRLSQSRKILGELVVVQVKNEKSSDIEPLPVRAFVSIVKQNESGVFRPITVAMSKEETRAQVLANAKAELDQIARKYNGILNFAELLSEYLQDLKR